MTRRGIEVAETIRFWGHSACLYLRYSLFENHQHGFGIHSPFLYRFVREVLCQDEPVPGEKQIEEQRKILRKNKTVVSASDPGEGSHRTTKAIRRISHWAKYSSVSPRHGRLLYRIRKWLKPDFTLELGTCLGMGTSYLSLADPSQCVFSIEGNSILANQARLTVEGCTPGNAKIIEGLFHEILPDLPWEKEKVSLIWLDGHHNYIATIQYVDFILNHVGDGSVIVLDDIRWSYGMWKAWNNICKDPRVTVSVDLFSMGILFTNRILQKQYYLIKF